MKTSERAVNIPIGKITLHGDLSVPPEPRGLVLFAHGSGSSRRSPRNRFVAAALQEAGMATLLFDLLTEAEERVDERTAELRFDIGLLASRLGSATDFNPPLQSNSPKPRIQGAAGDHPRRHPSVRRAGRAGGSGAAGTRVVCAASRPQAGE